MRSFSLLVLLSLTTGDEAKLKVTGCALGWVEFICKYPQTGRKYQDIDLVLPKGKETLRISEKDVWQKKNSRVSLYHDTTNKHLRVAIRQLGHEDFEKYRCQFYQRSETSPETEEVELDLNKDGCQTQFNQTAYRQTQTTITCGDSGNKRSSVQFFCRDDGFTCEDILSTDSPLKSNGTFSLTESSRGFSVSISNVSSHHAAVYWCGEKPGPGSYRAALRKIRLEVENITTFKRSPAVGQTFTYWCRYPNSASVKKFICKGEDPSTCQRLRSTTHRNMTSGRFSIEDDRVRRNLTITVRGVRADDTGTYWCGAESSDKRRSNKFFNRLLMTVVSSTTPSSPDSSKHSTTTPAERPAAPTSFTPSVSSAQSTTAVAERRGGPQLIVILIVCVAVLLLVFMLTLTLVYKRFLHPKNTAAARSLKEDYIYEEIQERVQKPDSGNAMNTIYATANFPGDPSASLYYSTIAFQSGSEALLVKPSSSACEYSAVEKSPTYWTINQPPRSSEVPLYSTVNSPQQ